MITRAAYEFGSVVITGACTIHSLANSVAKNAFQTNEIIPSLREALIELVTGGLVTWEVWAQKYGDGPHFKPEQQRDGRIFRQHWDRFFGNKASLDDFLHDSNTLRDTYEPTIEVEATDQLSNELEQYISRAK